MSRWSRLRNVFSDRAADDADEELRLHVENAIRNGRDPEEARRALGSPLRLREESRDARVIPWIDSLWADLRVAARQLRKRPVTSAAAVLSLALGIGSCLAAFRIADALLWRPLPIAHPERLYLFSVTGVTPEGKLARSYTWSYRQFAQMRKTVKDDATLLAASIVGPQQVGYAPSHEPERTVVEYVSADLFDQFGLRPAMGRLLELDDDRAPGASPSAVLSEGYWRARFGADPAVIGRTFQIGNTTGRIVGVVSGAFVGTEPGVRVDVFLPASMHPSFTRDDAMWLHGLAMVRPGATPATVRSIVERAGAVWHAYERERAKGFAVMPQAVIDQMMSLKVDLQPGPTGFSPLGDGMAMPLAALGLMVALVLLVACANVANLSAAQAAARGREMALRASIGAGRLRLIQLVGVECAVIAALATWAGLAFAAWAAPFVVARANPLRTPVYLPMPFDGRLAAVSAALALVVAALFGIWPVVRVSMVSPLASIRGFSPRITRRPVARALIAAQVAFCVLVVFVGGLLVTTFERLSTRALGFSPEDVVVLTVAARSPQPVERWTTLRDAMRARPGVVSAAIARWPMLEGDSWNSYISVDGAAPGTILGQFIDISPEFLDLMRMPLVAGRALTPFDRAAGIAVVNETFVRTFLNGVPPVAAVQRRFLRGHDSYEIVGVVRDAVYADVHQPIPPVAFVPFAGTQPDGSARQVSSTTIVLRLSSNEPTTTDQNWRAAVREAAPGVSVTAIRTQQGIVEAQTVRERLLAMLGAFFGVVSLVLAGVGLYGMLHFAVLHRRQEIGIRRAIGATAVHIAVSLTWDLVVTIAVGIVAGAGSGILAARALSTLLYATRPGDPAALAAPVGLVIGAAVLAAAVPIVRAVRISPLTVLRAD